MGKKSSLLRGGDASDSCSSASLVPLEWEEGGWEKGAAWEWRRWDSIAVPYVGSGTCDDDSVADGGGAAASARKGAGDGSLLSLGDDGDEIQDVPGWKETRSRPYRPLRHLPRLHHLPRPPLPHSSYVYGASSRPHCSLGQSPPQCRRDPPVYRPGRLVDDHDGNGVGDAMECE